MTVKAEAACTCDPVISWLIGQPFVVFLAVLVPVALYMQQRHATEQQHAAPVSASCIVSQHQLL